MDKGALPTMADSDRNRSRAPLSVDEAGDQIRTQRFTGRTTTNINTKAKLIAALKREQAKALAEGRVMAGALPEIHDQMSAADIETAQRTINTAMGRAPDHDFTGSKGNNSESRTARRAAGGAVIADNRGAAQVPAPQWPAGAPAAVSMGFTPGQPLAGIDASGATPVNPPAQIAGASGNPLLDSMVRDGTLPQGADLQRTGAGLQTRVMSESGERNVMIQPTGAQALEGQFGAVAQQQYGKPWGQLEPGQRRAILKANPVARTRGEVLANGQGKLNERGERFVNAAPSEFSPNGGIIREVDPSQDKTLTRLAAGDALLPKNALAGLLAPEQYADETGNRVASVSYGPRTMTGPVALDERGAVDVSGNFDIQSARNKANGIQQKAKGAADEIREGLKPKAPGQTPIPGESKPPITVPKDPALLAKAKDIAGEIKGQSNGASNPLAAIPVEPVAQAPAQEPRTNTFTPPEPSRPVVTFGTPEVGKRNTFPAPGSPLRTTGAWDAFKKGNLSEMAAHINNADVAATAAITDKARDLTRGSAFANTPLGQKFLGETPTPAPSTPAQNPVVNEQPPAPNVQPPPAVPSPKKKEEELFAGFAK